MDPATAGMSIQAVVAALSALVGRYKGGYDKAFQKELPVINMPVMSEEQKSLSDLMGQLGGRGAQSQSQSMLGSPYQGFQPIEDQARMNFAQQGMPGLAEQFGAMGEGATRGSAFPMALGQTSRDFERNLSQSRMKYGFDRQGQQQNLMSLLSGQGLQRSQDPIHEDKQTNPWAQLGGTAISTLLNQYVK